MAPTRCGIISSGGFLGIGVALLKMCVNVEVDFKDFVAKATQMCKTELFMSPVYQDVELSPPSPARCLNEEGLESHTHNTHTHPPHRDLMVPNGSSVL